MPRYIVVCVLTGSISWVLESPCWSASTTWSRASNRDSSCQHFRHSKRGPRRPFYVFECLRRCQVKVRSAAAYSLDRRGIISGSDDQIIRTMGYWDWCWSWQVHREAHSQCMYVRSGQPSSQSGWRWLGRPFFASNGYKYTIWACWLPFLRQTRAIWALLVRCLSVPSPPLAKWTLSLFGTSPPCSYFSLLTIPQVLDGHAGVYVRKTFCSSVAPQPTECSPCVSIVAPVDVNFVLLHVASVVLAESIDDGCFRCLSHESSQQPVRLEWTQVNLSRSRLLPKRMKFFGQMVTNSFCGRQYCRFVRATFDCTPVTPRMLRLRSPSSVWIQAEHTAPC